MWVLLEIKIYLDSKLRDVRLAQFMSELLPVLKRFSPQATGKSLRTRDIALRLGLPKQQCMQGKTGEDGSHSNIRLFMLMFMK